MVRLIGIVCALVAIANAAITGSPVAIEERVRRTTINPRSLLTKRDDYDPSLLYPAYTLSVPIDHFHNDSLYEPHSSESFELRYWFDATYYKPGGPVIVLQSGETDGVGRLPFLQKGILHQLAVATNGVGVVLEHRYYGASIPTPDFSTENLRFLTTDQALADEAYFAQHVVFKGLEQYDLTAPNTAYIGYGGSYAGAFVAFLRKLYPDIFWGVISSSGVTEAIYDYWAYYEPIRVYGEPTCISHVQKITNMVDNIFLKVNTSESASDLKSAFGLSNITHDNDFAVAISGVSSWQSRNWDPELNSPDFDEFCAAITSPTVDYNTTTDEFAAQDLLTKGGYASEISTLQTPLLNWIGWFTQGLLARCDDSHDRCFGTYNSTYYTQDSLDDDWRAWPYQYCTQWGYLQTGSGVPEDTLPLISRLSDLEYHSNICRQAFNISTPANVTAINKYGGFGISYPRLAIVDGEQDPWRPASPHASPFNSTALNRTSTVSEPFLLIEGAVHHWDENGLFPNQTVPGVLPPPAVSDTQQYLVAFVLEWMAEWRAQNHLELVKKFTINHEIQSGV
ncbi:hypothetical protein HYALB_00002791 [Hymenoscyphus albidus]|uniref:Uncharacterized protein n=1 Tax=Hymenoscyphus albidus TaxID=595503 RepID=A0A9N9LKE5_9HELO|nr:hypothetical protein HYALB_00002791 [Hymenoscyphus albidus]